MKIFKIKRKTRIESRHHSKMGCLTCKVTRIYRTFLNIPYKQLRAQRETYYGKVKELKNCRLEK